MPSNRCEGQKGLLDRHDTARTQNRAEVARLIGVYNRLDCSALTPAELASLPCEAREDCAERWKVGSCEWTKCKPENAPEFDPALPAPTATPGR